MQDETGIRFGKPFDAVLGFMKRKGVTPSVQCYAIDAMSAMAQGLFASLLVGTILDTAAGLSGLAFLGEAGSFAKSVAGPAMAIAIGYSLKAPLLALLSLAAVGYAANALGGAGGPLAVLVIAILSAEVGKMVSGETKVDILVTPLAVILCGCGVSALLAPGIGACAAAVGDVVMWATDLHPFLMGILVSVVVGIALTLPISSAAICAALGLTGLAGGAALAGCCAQMIGFAFMSYRENGWGGVVSQGLGTSMLQMPNIVRKPAVWVPPIIASAVGGPIATCVFGLCQNGPAIASGMGTCGLVGPIGVLTGWAAQGVTPGAFEWFGLAVVCLVVPAAVSCAVHGVMVRAGILETGDLTLSS